MTDLISRQAAIDAVRKLYIKEPKINNDYAYDMAIDAADNAIRELPSAVKHGEWIFDPDGTDWGIPAWVCSECRGRNSMIPTYICGKGQRIKVEHPLRWAGSKFCPNCGLPMRERNEE